MPIKPTKRKGKPSSGTTRASSTINLSWDRPTGNFWVDTGLVVLLRHFGEGEHPIEEVLQWLQSRLRQPSGKQGEYYDELAGEIRPYDKVNWVYPTNLFIKVSGKPGKKVKIEGKHYPTQPPVFELLLELSKRSEICDLCGDKAPLTDAKMWMYPFVVDLQKFGTFYPARSEDCGCAPDARLRGLRAISAGSGRRRDATRSTSSSSIRTCRRWSACIERFWSPCACQAREAALRPWCFRVRM